VAEAFPEGERDHLTLLVGQDTQSMTEALLLLGGGEERFRAVGRGDVFETFRLFGRDEAAAGLDGAPTVQRTATRHHTEPTGNGATIRVVTASQPPNLLEDVEGDFVGFVGVAEDTQSYRMHVAVRLIVEIGEGARVTCRDSHHEQKPSIGSG